jgi:hypothetical protein
LSDSPKRALAITVWCCLGGAVLGAGLPGCSRQPDEGLVVGDSTYVDVMAHLLLLRDSLDAINLPHWSKQQVLDSVETAIADERGVTADDLFEFSRTAGRDAVRMMNLWTEIQARVDSIRPPGEEDEEGSSDRPGQDRRVPADRPGSRRTGG